MIKDFSYEDAKKLGKNHPGKIVTKNGQIVTIFWGEPSSEYPIAGVINGSLYRFDRLGRADGNEDLRLYIEVPAPKQKKPKLEPVYNEVQHTFSWHPVTVEPENLDEPIIFLTDKGRMVTHAKLRSVRNENGSSFNRYRYYANAVAWVYQNELFDANNFKEK